MAVALGIANASVRPMDDHLGLLVDCNLSGCCDGLGLRRECGGNARTALTTDRPFTVVSYYVLSGHWYLASCDHWLDSPATGCQDSVCNHAASGRDLGKPRLQSGLPFLAVKEHPHLPSRIIQRRNILWKR